MRADEALELAHRLDHGYPSAERKEAAALIRELVEELSKAQDELHCTEVELEVAACSLPDDAFNQGFECMGDYVKAVAEGFKAALAARDAECIGLREALRRRYGYAKGHYMNRCHRCELTTEWVDKRCHVCLDCADKAIDAEVRGLKP